MDCKIFLTLLNQTLTLGFILPFVVALCTFLTIRLRFLQVAKLRLSFHHLLSKKPSTDTGSVTHFEALSAVLAGNFGTGNISGIAVAIAHGGPGALVWMWITAFLGSIIQYASCLLAVKYRRLNPQGEHVGGPMYYLRDGLGWRTAGTLFAIFTLFGALTVGNLAQVNSILLPLHDVGIHPMVSGIVLAAASSLVILGGLQRVAKFASVIVPIKALLYLGTVFLILAWNYTQILPAFALMLTSAFDWSSMAGGTLGYGTMRMITTGFNRGIFATDAGTGIVPILQAGARTEHPVVDGIVTLVAPLLVMVICTATGLVLIVTGAWQTPDLQSTMMVSYAFTKGLGSDIGRYIVIIALAFFAYTTLIAWSCCGEKAMEFLGGLKASRMFRYVFIAIIPFGSMLQVDLVWLLADLAISAMLSINLLGIAGLSHEVVADSRTYFKKRT
jgi:AGCS family alanine or glycine:cation symporter